MNASPAWALHVSPLFARALRVALDAAADTDGLVDPTLGAALEACRVRPRLLAPARTTGRRPGPAAPSRLGEVRLDGPHPAPAAGAPARPERRREGRSRSTRPSPVSPRAASSPRAATSPRAARSTSAFRAAAPFASCAAVSPRAASSRAAGAAAARSSTICSIRAPDGRAGTRPGSRSRSPARAASPPTWPRRPRSCSARTGPRGSTSGACRPASSPATASVVLNGAWQRETVCT